MKEIVYYIDDIAISAALIFGNTNRLLIIAGWITTFLGWLGFFCYIKNKFECKAIAEFFFFFFFYDLSA